MNPAGPILPAELDAWLHTALAAERIDASYAAFVRQHAAAPDDGWRWCCGSNCDPCVQRLGRVVDAYRQRAGLRPPQV